MPNRYDNEGDQRTCEPGSDNQVLRNKLGMMQQLLTGRIRLV